MPWARYAATPSILLLLAMAAVAAPSVTPTVTGLRVPHWQPQWPWPQPDDPKEEIDAQWARTLEALWATTHEKLGFCIGSSQRRAQVRAAAWCGAPGLALPARAASQRHARARASVCGCTPGFGLACLSCQPAQVLCRVQAPKVKHLSSALPQRLVALSFPWPLPTSNNTVDAICSNQTRIDLHLCSPPEIELYYKVSMLSACTACTAGPVARQELLRHRETRACRTCHVVAAVHVVDREPGKGARQPALQRWWRGPASVQPGLL